MYTCVKMDESSGSWRWHQEVDDMILAGSQSTAPKNASPWLVLRFNTVDGEDYGRGRVEEFIGDLRSLEGLSQALVEGASVASKVVFLVSPSATTKPEHLPKLATELSYRVDQKTLELYKLVKQPTSVQLHSYQQR